MKKITKHELCLVSGGRRISNECIGGLVGEGLAYASLFCVTTVVGAGIAVAGLFVAPIVLAIACKNG